MLVARNTSQNGRTGMNPYAPSETSEPHLEEPTGPSPLASLVGFLVVPLAMIVLPVLVLLAAVHWFNGPLVVSRLQIRDAIIGIGVIEGLFFVLWLFHAVGSRDSGLTEK